MSTGKDIDTSFTGCRPVLRVADLQASLAYYCDTLGFTMDWSWPLPEDRPPGGHATSTSVFRGHFELSLSQEHPVGLPMTIVVGLPTRQAVDALFHQYATSEALVTDPPSERPWGTYEIRVSDLDGHILRVLRGSDTRPSQYGVHVEFYSGNWAVNRTFRGVTARGQNLARATW